MGFVAWSMDFSVMSLQPRLPGKASRKARPRPSHGPQELRKISRDPCHCGELQRGHSNNSAKIAAANLNLNICYHQGRWRCHSACGCWRSLDEAIDCTIAFPDGVLSFWDWMRACGSNAAPHANLRIAQGRRSRRKNQISIKSRTGKNFFVGFMARERDPAV